MAKEGDIHKKALNALDKHFKAELCGFAAIGGMDAAAFADGFCQGFCGENGGGYSLKGTGAYKARGFSNEEKTVFAGLEIRHTFGTVNLAGLGFQCFSEAETVFSLYALFLLFEHLTAVSGEKGAAVDKIAVFMYAPGAAFAGDWVKNAGIEGVGVIKRGKPLLACDLH